MSVNISVSQSGIHISLNAIVKELGKQTRDVCHESVKKLMQYVPSTDKYGHCPLYKKGKGKLRRQRKLSLPWHQIRKSRHIGSEEP
eukprot:546392-Pelagomonas_calceolata.AAC.3